MTTLVTGAAGFLGYHLCRLLAGQGHEVVGVDSINSYYSPALKLDRLAELGIPPDGAQSGSPCRSSTIPGLRFQKLALEDRAGIETLFARDRFDRVCHLAAQAGVRYSLENPRAYIESNIVGFLNVLEGCRATRVGHLVFASSSSVYGLSRQMPFSEHAHTDHPVSLYAASKKADEMMAHAYAHLYGLPATGLRFFTVYGPWGRPDMAYYKFARAIVDGRPIDLFNSGEMKRDFTYVDDVTRGIALVCERPATADPSWDAASPDPAGSSAPFRIYNLGACRAEPVGRLVSALERGLGRTAKRRLLPMQPGDVAETEADLSLLERDFGWKPTTTLDDGVAKFVQWFKDYEKL